MIRASGRASGRTKRGEPVRAGVDLPGSFVASYSRPQLPGAHASCA